MIERAVVAFLKEIATQLPGAAPALQAVTTGSEVAGYTDRLVLGLTVNGRREPIFIDEGDLEKPAAQLAEEVRALLQRLERERRALEQEPQS